LFCFVFRFAQELSNSEGNILENKALLLSLDETKAKSMDITTKLAESAELQISLNQQVIRTNLFSFL
jgi:dynein heavy chain 2